MIKSPVELTKVLCDQAENSGFARAAIIVIIGHDGNVSKTEFGFNKKDPNSSPEIFKQLEAGENQLEAAKIDEEQKD